MQVDFTAKVIFPQSVSTYLLVEAINQNMV